MLFHSEKQQSFIMLFPNAKVVFATSTPIIESGFGKDAYRLNCDVRKYNEIAVEICKKHGYIINDLYKVLEGVPEDYYIDCAHPYTEEGTVLTTNAVVKAISEVFGLAYKEFVLDEEDRKNIKQKIEQVLGI